ncbi:hypothetical protein EV693_1199 [Nicoletella semolina]|uniref:Uncharacterized protein n=1 Tax=Nicoletella semolina TaxID=271160 RepID=A0A4R2N4B7_9PAST|nr:hypothetical protein [Nicoletella semolina]MDH2925237.1 hypothetical protein [Nicoletella semolina]TCP15299.1 hypothetical protein EV693_1199 [Nicoletella semolina]
MLEHHHSPSKLEIATHSILPLSLMLFAEMFLNHFSSIPNTIFISPYLLAFFITCIILFIVLLKGQICLGQRNRLLAILPLLSFFALGNFAYTLGFTPKHSPMLLACAASLLLPLLYWKLPDDEHFARIFIYCGLGIASVGTIQYLLIYWFELPSLFNGIRANNFAQLLLGILLAGWYLVLAKSRLEGFLKLLALSALFAIILNYVWTIIVLYQHLQIMPEMAINAYIIFFAMQFFILGLLAWILLTKNIKNLTAWTLATLLAMLYPFTNSF